MTVYDKKDCTQEVISEKKVKIQVLFKHKISSFMTDYTYYDDVTDIFMFSDHKYITFKSGDDIYALNMEEMVSMKFIETEVEKDGE